MAQDTKAKRITITVKPIFIRGILSFYPRQNRVKAGTCPVTPAGRGAGGGRIPTACAGQSLLAVRAVTINSVELSAR